MMFSRERFNFGHVFLVVSILLCSSFAYWLYQDSDVDQYRKFARIYKRMILYVQYDEAKELHAEVLAKIIDAEKLDEAWLPFVKTIPEKKIRVDLYARILADNPNREDTYEQLAFIIDDVFPEEGHIVEKNDYLNKLKTIPEINHALLDKHNLIIN